MEPGPFKSGSPEFQDQAEELIALSADLTDRQKMTAEYWSDGPYTEQPPGHWARFAQFVSERDHHTLDNDVKMFFALTNAMLDASIAAWGASGKGTVKAASLYPTLQKAVQPDLEKVKTEEWRARGDSNSRPRASEARALSS